MNQEAFWERQYEQNIDRMVGVCYRYVADLPLAEDLAHDAFLKAIEKSDTYHATGKFNNWLMKIAVNETLMYRRDRHSDCRTQKRHWGWGSRYGIGTDSSHQVRACQKDHHHQRLRHDA